MWLLGTARANLVFFPRPEHVPEPGYAILSHTWGPREDTFQAVQKLNEEAKQATPADALKARISELSLQAEKFEYEFAWVDTCCIDKTSSAELSEAINSMFQYYSHSAVCYVYLSDVPSIPYEESFRRSKWHFRGWTLQELLASPVVLFFSEQWELLGTKHDLAQLLYEATGVPAAVLRFETDIQHMSIVERLSWASRRETTRPEDIAYCLFGIFGINMPTLYGEGGEKAFYRLLEEIMKTSHHTQSTPAGEK
ncbi:heterokaryon incompatibility protein-domain-containing protein [Epithele typhae]|uniref:heterokaryon incompatibility protein-domain-containing protein n=1 Tax=Epithele typhae TaxID=378194 RepID=UPI0020083F45|nr:heterokaryon incompatibility protein-domain-containing protein [Epithele typhae]KAH9914765.1 heterokaryon incompatibility protein-domain-containing protein [Epithele typhae]